MDYLHCFVIVSDLDEEESDRRRNECLDDMSDLERQFSDVREQYVPFLISINNSSFMSSVGKRINLLLTLRNKNNRMGGF